MTTTTVSSRQTGKVISQIIEANQIISLTEPSVVTINQPAGWATGYSRSGDDLTLDTQAGTLHYNNFFSAGSSTLVFDDGAAPATQAVFSSDAADSSLTPVFTAYRPATASGSVAQAAAVQAEEGITFDPITGDDILYGDETSGDITITGHAPVSAQGGTIVVTAFEDPAYSYTGTVAADGSWQVTVPEYDFSGAPNGVYTLAAELTAPDGTVTTTHDVTFNQRPFEGYLYFYSLTGDGVLTPDEQAQGMLIEGAFINDSGLYSDHYAVTITLTDNTNAQSFTYTTTLGEDGYWQVTAPAEDLAQLTDGSATLVGTVTDAAGNSITVAEPLILNLQQGEIIFDPIAGDNVLTADELHTGLVISGSSRWLPDQSLLEVKINGVSHTAALINGSEWSVTFPPEELAQFPNGPLTVTVTTSDFGVNDIVATTEMLVDRGPLPGLDTPFGDNILDSGEAARGQTLTGATGFNSPGQHITVTLAGTDYTTEAEENGVWQLLLPAAALQALPEGDITMTVTATDADGNSASVEHTFSVNPSGLTVNPVTDDNMVVSYEAEGDITISGRAPTDKQGATVTVTLLDQPERQYTGSVEADGTWAVALPGGNVSGLSNGNYTLVAELTDADGNTTSVTHDFLMNFWPLEGSITFDDFTGDGVLTAGERTQDQVLSGRFLGLGSDVNGLSITVYLHSSLDQLFTYTGTTDANGNWSVIVPATDLQQLSEGWGYMTATATDAVGNGVSTEREEPFTVLPADSGTITVNPIAGDNVLTADEVADGLTISGSSTYMGERYTQIEVEINGTLRIYADYDSNWSVTFGPEFVATLPDGPVTVTASGYDLAGNRVTTTATLEVNLSDMSTLTFDPVTGDDILYGDETSGEITITGHAPVSAQGGTIVVTAFGDPAYSYTGTVAADGSWQVTVPEYNFGGTSNGIYTLVAELTAPDGTVTTATHDIAINQWPFSGDFYFDDFTGDGALTAAERTQDQTFSGTFASEENSVSGLAITVYMHDNDGQTFAYTGTTDSNGRWSVTVPAADLQQLSEGWSYMTATAEDAVGNTAPSSREADFAVLPATGGTITVNPIAGDNVLTADEVDGGLTISGSSTYMGERYTELQVEINGEIRYYIDYYSDWSVTFSPEFVATLPDGPVTVTVSGSDVSGNLVTTTSTLVVDLGNVLTLAIDRVTGDDVLYANETAEDILITGRAPVSAAGGTIAVTVFDDPDYRYTGTVEANGTWQVTVPAGSFNGIANGVYPLVAELTAPDGTVSSVSRDITLSQQILSGELTFDALTGDDIITSGEKTEDQILSGQFINSDGVNHAGLLVSIEIFFNGDYVTYTTTTGEEGRWQVTIPAADLSRFPDGQLYLDGTVYDAAGNGVSNQKYIQVTTDPAITLDPIAGDNIINIAEAAAGVVLSGQSSEAGGVVSVQLNGVTYEADVNDEGGWRLALPKEAIAGLEDGRYTLTFSQTGSNGQTTTITESLLLDADPANRPVLRIHTISGDNLINGAELQSDQIITGSSENVESGQTLSLKIGGVTYTTQVQAGGGWSLIVPAEDLAALGDGGLTLRASVTDASGNRATASRNLNIKSDRDGLSIDPVTGDNLINAGEAGGTITLTGHTDGVRHGATVQLTLNGEHYTAKVGKDGSWSAKVPAADVAALDDGSVTLTACVKSACGQMLYAKAVLTVDTRAPELTLAPVTGDNLISQQEAQAGFALTGSAGMAAAGLLVLVVLNGVEYHAKVQAGGDWSVAIPAEALADQPAGDYPLAISLTDVAGNLATLTHTVTLEAAPDTDAVETTAALTVASQATEVESADSTLTTALAVPDAPATEHAAYAIGGVTLDLAAGGGEATGGSGNDTILLSTLDFLHIDGGSGTDTLLLAGSDLHLDLTVLGLKIENIDIVDLGNGHNSLTLGQKEAQAVTGQPDEDLVIRGATGSQLTL
ncbi:MAG: Ig-like domain-containing protein, partial [Yersiniaceae bacterium]|nr:Ig-like domain-containing protein [Yersiniaceae bacterium]